MRNNYSQLNYYKIKIMTISHFAHKGIDENVIYQIILLAGNRIGITLQTSN